jgi:hypothetical protein
MIRRCCLRYCFVITNFTNVVRALDPTFFLTMISMSIVQKFFANLNRLNNLKRILKIYFSNDIAPIYR